MIIDVNEPRKPRSLALPNEHILFAAGMDRLLVLLQDQNLLVRWNLITLEKELTVHVPLQGNVKQLALGSASNGPLLIDGVRGPDTESMNFAFLDIQTMRVLPAKVISKRLDMGWGPPHHSQVRVSANGRVVGMVGDHDNHTLVFRCNDVELYFADQPDQDFAPGPDGQVVYRDNALLTKELKPLAQPTNDGGTFTFFVPAQHGPYYVGIQRKGPFRPFEEPDDSEKERVPLLPLEAPRPGQSGKPSAYLFDLSVYAGIDGSPIAQLTDVEGPAGLNGWSRPRLYLIPDAKLLVVVPRSSDRLIFHRLDIEKAMEKTSKDYLFVTSQAPLSVKRGQMYQYQLASKSKKGGVKYKLTSGPKGMEVSADGLIKWPVPPDWHEGEIDAAVLVSDDSGENCPHTFSVTIHE